MFAVVLTGEALVNFGYTLPPTEMDPPPPVEPQPCAFEGIR